MRNFWLSRRRLGKKKIGNHETSEKLFQRGKKSADSNSPETILSSLNRIRIC
jgi:hypothetical protein